MYNPNINLYQLEKEHILSALKYFDGNKTQAANALGIAIKTLYNKLHEYGEFKNFIVKPNLVTRMTIDLPSGIFK